MRHLIDIIDFSKQELDALLSLGLDIKANPEKYRESAKYKKLATLFFEPSTRTRLSFEAAMLELGGTVIGFSQSSSSSVAKGESLQDTVRTAGCYSDIVAMRHPMEGAPLLSAQASTVPVINAGDGGHCHPTQTLADLLSMLSEKGRINGLHIGLCGDLKYGRTVHSLINALAYFTDIKITLISPVALGLPEYIKNDALQQMQWDEAPSLKAAAPSLDVLYMTRIQRERFSSPEQYNALEGAFILTPDIMSMMKSDATVLHPLPRVDEIPPTVDSDPRAAYFRQMVNGKIIRMALLLTLLSDTLQEKPLIAGETTHSLVCNNPRCITTAQRDVTHVFTKKHANAPFRCAYCEQQPGEAL